MLTLVYTQSSFADLTFQHQTFADHQFEVEILSTDGMASPEAQRMLARAQVVLMGADQALSAPQLAAMPHLKMISVIGVGFDRIDLEAANARGIWVSNTPDYGMDEVSNHAIMLMLVLARGFAPTSADARAGHWNPASIRPLTRLHGQTAGIIGLGRIGKTAARKLNAFGLRVLAYDPYIPSWDFGIVGATSVPLETLLRESDYISLHAPHTAETNHIINHESLMMMKPSACLINTARGGLVDEAAVLNALNNNRLRAAGLDVLSIEPPPPDHPVLGPLLRHPRAHITPHIAYYSEQGLRDMRVKSAENIVAWARAGKPNTPVNQPNAQLPTPGVLL